MRVPKMKKLMHFKPKVFAMSLLACALIAGVASWMTGLNFWILAGIFVVALLVNGFIASIEDENSSKSKEQ